MGNRIVLSTYGSLGDLHPYVAIAKRCCEAQIALELQQRGHYPVIATYEAYRFKVEVDGII